jgi:L-cysteine S-thiosulfotransferase
MRPSLYQVTLVIFLALLAAACSKQDQSRQVPRSSMGAALFGERCRDCHKVERKGGEVGPDLTKSVKKGNKAFIEQVIREPSKVFPGTVMPHYKDLSVREVNALVEYVGGLK